MRWILLFCVIRFTWSCAEKSSDHTLANTNSPLNQTNTYDSVTARAWGADKYGMKQYVLVFLKRGPNRSQDSVTRVKLQEAHMANINRLANEGKLLLAGPMMQDEEIRGIYLFDVKTLEEAKALTETDPAIQAGSLILEMHPWYGSAALMELPKLHNKGAKIQL